MVPARSATVLVAMIASHAHSAVVFTGVGVQSTGGGVSNGGTVATGQLAVTSLSAFVWTPSGGATDIGGLTGSFNSRGVGVSADGSVVAGRCEFGSTWGSFAWTSSGGFTDIGSIGGVGPIAGGISHDGTTIVGTEQVTPLIDDPHLIRWRAATGIQDLGIPVGADFVRGGASNATGSAIAASAAMTAGGYQAVRWTESGGYAYLGTLPAATSSFANGINGNGTVIVGTSDGAPFRWTEGVGMAPLPTLPARNLGTAADVSADGLIAVGSSEAIGLSPIATMWLPVLGVVDLNTYLPALGVDLTGWVLHTATDISPDGTTIAGMGSHEYEPGNVRKEFWVVVLPAPGAAAMFVVAMAIVGVRRTRPARID